MALPATAERPILSERMLRPITFLKDVESQSVAMNALVASRTKEDALPPICQRT